MFSSDKRNDEMRSDFEEWFDDNLHYFPLELVPDQQSTPGIEAFYRKIYCPVMRDLQPALRELIKSQYPYVSAEKRPLLVLRLDRIIERTGHVFLLKLFDLLFDEKNGVNLRLKYRDFEKWRIRYARPQRSGKPYELKPEESEQDGQQLTDPYWDEELTWKERRKREFVDMLQSVVFKYFPVVDQLDADGWIVYSSLVSIEYFEYRFSIEHWETFIEFGFDEKDLSLTYPEFQEALSIRIKERIEGSQSINDD